jgi:4-alpha-glucanotransferase
VVAQIYSLPGGTTREFGDFSALKQFCKRAGESGASAVAISPVHALLPWSLANYSPYAPSSRQFLNPMFASLGRTMNSPSTSSLIRWSTAYPKKLKALETCYQTFKTGSRDVDKFRAFVEQGGDRLLAHARFEVLHARFAKQGLGHWREWPEAFRDSGGPAVQALDAGDPEIEFHLFAQWRAASSLADAQRTAKSAGMDIGLIADLAVGIDPNGSDAWSRPGDMLCGLTIGAPPDALGPDGQDWGLTTFAPQALRRTGFDGFLSTLRAVLRPAGGIRIDHAMGFGRLWVVPQGASSRAGVYLTYPFEELMALTALEASRHRAIVIAEDLGTVPAGFRAQLARRNFRGMRVLWFERTRTGSFLPSHSWARNACAMTSTHDLPTIAGWWRGRDIAWRARLSHEATPASTKRAKRMREADRKRLWKSLKKENCVAGARPPVTQAHKLVDGVLRLAARARCEIALFPLEDIVGAVEQPNLPGTVDTHPNWRRRFGAGALATKTSRLRFALIDEERRAASPRRRPPPR